MTEVPQVNDQPSDAPQTQRKPTNPWFKLVTWVLAIGCFYLVYTRIDASAGREGLTVLEYMQRFFGEANWLAWLALMIPYSIFFFLVDAHATWRVVRWFNAPNLKYTEVLPIRASAYILSLINEQVGKGAMSLYLYKRHNVAGWQIISSMIFLGLVEIYQLLLASSVGVLSNFSVVEEASSKLPLSTIIPSVLIGAAIYLPLHILYFRGKILPSVKLREQPIFHAFRQAEVKHYFMLLLFKLPNLIGAVIVYTLALDLFQVDVSFGQMVAFLPVIFLAAALPLPFHAGALVLWTILFPDYPEVGAFSLVMHTFFVLFNAAIGLVFLPKANKELFGS